VFYCHTYITTQSHSVHGRGEYVVKSRQENSKNRKKYIYILKIPQYTVHNKDKNENTISCSVVESAQHQLKEGKRLVEVQILFDKRTC